MAPETVIAGPVVQIGPGSSVPTETHANRGDIVRFERVGQPDTTVVFLNGDPFEEEAGAYFLQSDDLVPLKVRETAPLGVYQFRVIPSGPEADSKSTFTTMYSITAPPRMIID
jgi:hypothetical protein